MCHSQGAFRSDASAATTGEYRGAMPGPKSSGSHRAGVGVGSPTPGQVDPEVDGLPGHYPLRHVLGRCEGGCCRSQRFDELAAPVHVSVGRVPETGSEFRVLGGRPQALAFPQRQSHPGREAQREWLRGLGRASVGRGLPAVIGLHPQVRRPWPARWRVPGAPMRDFVCGRGNGVASAAGSGCSARCRVLGLSDRCGPDARHAQRC
mmetsp:Transcript_3510/g.8720  ORF Transcript_3510/g.8720 Transcript_3510/m.8720 type:complete len:206 (-) Transcript_3510:147-764(-)